MASAPKLPLVQALRAFAALLVVAQHVQHDAAALDPRFAPSGLLPWNAGVDVFFVISGFIIVHASRPLFARPGAWKSFLARRAARVVPLYWLATTLYLGVAAALPGALGSERPGAGLVVASYLFWPLARPDGYVQPVYSLGWTLNYEVFFYALSAACLALPLRRAAALLCAMLAALVVLGLAPLPEPLAFWTQPLILEFAAGVLLALARAEGARVSRGLAAALAAAGLILLLTIGDAEPGGARVLAYGVPAALLVAGATLGPVGREDGAAARAMVALGDASYALYLVHPFASRAVRLAAGQLGLVGAPLPFLLVAGLAAVAAGLAVHALIERPLERRVRRLLAPRVER